MAAKLTFDLSYPNQEIDFKSYSLTWDMWLKLNITNRKSSNRKCVNTNPYKHKQTFGLNTVLLEFSS